MQVTDWLLVQSGAAAHWSDQNLFDKIRFWPLICNRIASQAAGLGRENKKSNTRVTPLFWVGVHNTKTTLPMFLAAHCSSLVWWPLPNVSHSTHLHSIDFSLYQVHFLYLSYPTFFQPQSKQSGNDHFLAYITIVISAQAGEGGRRAFSLSLYLSLRTKIHSPYLSSTPYMYSVVSTLSLLFEHEICWQILTNKLWKIID